MFYIRTDGNTAIGIGHVMRCLSIAEAAEKIGNGKPFFLLADSSCYNMVTDRGFEAKVLSTDYRKMQSEIQVLSNFLKKEDVILVDSYQVTVEYYTALRKLCKVACLEDMGDAYPVDLLINYNIYAPRLLQNYKQDNSPDRVLLGAEYMPLREMFQQDMDYVIKDKVTDVMITTGGSDPCFAAGSILEGIESRMYDRNGSNTLYDEKQKESKCGMSNYDGIRYHVVSGPFNRFAAELKSKYAGREHVVVHENVSDMKALMRQCDVVITATGSTVYEVSALGVPMICFYFAENQRQGAEELARLTDVVNAGGFAQDKDKVVFQILETLARCICNKDYRERLLWQERSLIDGRGAVRIAEQISKLQTL